MSMTKLQGKKITSVFNRLDLIDTTLHNVLWAQTGMDRDTETEVRNLKLALLALTEKFVDLEITSWKDGS